MNKTKLYPSGVLRYSLKTNLPGHLVGFLRLLMKILPNKTPYPLKIRFLAMQSHLELIKDVDFGSENEFPKVDILIPFHPKDIVLLNKCLHHVVKNTINPINTVRIITTSSGVVLAKEKLVILGEELSKKNICLEIVDENEFLPTEILETCKSFGEGSGWLIQQSIKFWNGIVNREYPTVVIDSDTLIIQKILWINRLNKSNVFANFHENDISDYFISIFPNILRSTKDYGYISHFVLMKPEIILEIFSKVEQSKKFQDISSSFQNEEKNSYLHLARVLNLILHECMFNFSEYDIYAKAALRFEPEKTIACKWSNLSIDINEEVDDEFLQHVLRTIKSDYLSLSIHTHSLGYSGSTRTQEIIESRLKSSGSSK